ncbi:MAG: hypothetical protein EOO07_12660 [Chitinophagaceae bacterium]|nr:MAG: hypothetical protein EOO07_12660 [Chitinophagaceae bacterium]
MPKIYLSGEIGASFIGGGRNAAFIYAPGIGFATPSFDAGVRYESIDNVKMVAFRVAYGFSL